MKIEVGMYVRTIGDAYEPSKIGKIKEVDIVSFKEVCYRIDSCGKHILIPESFIKKASHNLIDLIEVGDIVNGQFITDLNEIYEYDKISGKYRLIYVDSILTHEQYEANCYKVVE